MDGVSSVMFEPQTQVVRASSTADFIDCQRRWAARNLRREITALGYQLNELRASVGARMGTSVHAFASVSLSEMLRTGELAPVGMAMDVAMQTLAEGLREDVLLDACTPHRTHAELQVRNQSNTWRQMVAPKIIPRLVETRFEAEFNDRVIISGQQDVLAHEPGRIRDLKTGRHEPKCRPQVGIYSLLAKTHGYQVEEAIVDWVPREPISKPQPPARSFVYPLAEVEAAGAGVLRHIDWALRRFREGDVGLEPGDPWAFIANPNSNLCSAKYCPAHGTDFCKEHKRNA